jgi:hypothetical protein
MLDGPLERQSIPHYLISYELLLLGFLIKGVVKYDELQDSQSLNFLLSAIRNACLGSLIALGKALQSGIFPTPTCPSPSNVFRKHSKKIPNIFRGHLKFINIPPRK